MKDKEKISEEEQYFLIKEMEEEMSKQEEKEKISEEEQYFLIKELEEEMSKQEDEELRRMHEFNVKINTCTNICIEQYLNNTIY